METADASIDQHVLLSEIDSVVLNLEGVPGLDYLAVFVRDPQDSKQYWFRLLNIPLQGTGGDVSDLVFTDLPLDEFNSIPCPERQLRTAVRNMVRNQIEVIWSEDEDVKKQQAQVGVADHIGKVKPDLGVLVALAAVKYNRMRLANYFKGGITLCMAGDPEERVQQLTAPGSALRLKKGGDGVYCLTSRDPTLTRDFSYYASGPERRSREQVREEAQRSLGFEAGSELCYAGSILEPEKTAAFRKVVMNIAEKGIPFYMVATDGGINTALVMGYNPITGANTVNPVFKGTVPALL
jgi:hypothetical protein